MMHRFLFAAAFALAGTLSAQDHVAAAPAKVETKAAYEQRAAIYPITTCIVSGEELDADAVTFAAGGTTFKTCCAKCQAKVEKDPATYQQKLTAASQKAQLTHYPLKTCPISGEALGGMGEPVQLMLDSTLVQVCCKHCVEKAQAAAPAMVKKVLDAAHDAQVAAYPLDTCLVSGEKLGADAKDVMFGTLLVRMCCDKCASAFEKDSAKFVAKLHEAYAKKMGGDDKGHDGKEHGGKEHDGKEHDGKEHAEGHGNGHK